MGIKEKVKKGLLSVAEAQNLVAPDSHTYGWCERRARKPVTTTPQNHGPETNEGRRKYRRNRR